MTGPATATGTLSASDVDDGETATLVWSITGPTTYGAMTINAATGAWLYTLDNDLAATQALNEGRYRHPDVHGDRDRRERRDRYADGHDHHHGHQ